MNLLIDPYHNRILLYEERPKKEPPFFYERVFDYSLWEIENQAKAIIEISQDENAKPETPKKESFFGPLLKYFVPQGLSLIIPDSGIGFGTFDLPSLNWFKMNDVFFTRFKSSYPNFESFYVSKYEYERNNSGSTYFYSFFKKERMDRLTSALKAGNVEVGSIDYLSSAYALHNQAAGVYPKATLFVGEDNSELVITKGRNVLHIHEFGYGSKLLLSGETYMESAYQHKYEKAVEFSAFATENFAKKIAFTDENIGKTDTSNTFKVSAPRETRILKDDVLRTYNAKNNVRRYYALVADTLSYYSKAPWFLPISEVQVVGGGILTAMLAETAKGQGDIGFIEVGEGLYKDIVSGKIKANKLFRSRVKKERRTFDWKKLLTMEIGRKKG